MKKSTTYTERILRGSKFTRKNKEIKTRLIQFINRTMEDLVRAITNLKSRYHKKVSLSKIKLVRGLYQGYLTCA